MQLIRSKKFALAQSPQPTSQTADASGAVLRHRLLLYGLGVLLAHAAGIAPAQTRLFESDSKRFGNAKMDIVLREVERRARVSVVDIQIRAIGSSVGSSFFVLCSLRDLGRVRGGYRFIAKVEERPRPGQMLVGFLSTREEPLDVLGPEFASIRVPEGVIDLDQFAPICDTMK